MNRFAYVHPLFITGLLLAPMVVLPVADGLTPGRGIVVTPSILAVLSVVSSLAGAAQLAWVWSLYEEASVLRRRHIAEHKWGRALFIGVSAILVALGVWGWLAPEQVLEVQARQRGQGPDALLLALTLIAIVGGFLTCCSVATQALLAAELPVPRAYSYIGTLLFMLYLVVGVWTLRPRLIALRH